MGKLCSHFRCPEDKKSQTKHSVAYSRRLTMHHWRCLYQGYESVPQIVQLARFGHHPLASTKSLEPT